jgi:putative membrane-bound dehydrogenase-like protein
VICQVLLFSAVGRALETPAGALPPAAERETFRLADPRLRIDLAAAEPEVASPVAIAWDADGFLFVAEMIDYPVAPPAGRIRRLEDRDGDGLYERATVYAEGLAFPNSVLPCFGGVLVTAAPDLWFLRDSDGDGRSDERRVVLTGFGKGNTQLRANGLYWGLDNWIYAANGRSDGDLRAPDWPPSKAVSIRRRDVRFRFRPNTKKVDIESVAGFSQFGLAHDDWGNRFPSWNTIPLRHVVLEQSALDRNPFLAETTSVALILDNADGGRVFSRSPVQARFNRESVDYFNASCGPMIFRGDRLPAVYRGNAFVCEPLTNLVHRRVLEPSGCTFWARRVEVNQEFLASTDPSFRPVNLTTGPDGALYIVDMYREMVEHPEFVPPDVRKTVQFRRWHDRGRIWRVRSALGEVGTCVLERRPCLSKASIQQLVNFLDHPVGWWRDTAGRLLVERQDRHALPLLEKRVRSAANPLCRLHALAALAGMGALNATILEQAANDHDPGVREHALRASAVSPADALPLWKVVSLAGDPVVRVRLQAALALGGRGPESRQVLPALAALASRDAADPWVRLAITSSLGESALPFLEAWLTTRQDLLESAQPGELRMLSEIAALVGVRRRRPDLLGLLQLVEPAGRNEPARVSGLLGRLALTSGLGEGLDRSGPPLSVWLAEPANKGRPEVSRLPSLWPAAQALAVSDRPATQRLLALETLVRGQPELARPIIARLLLPDQPAVLQTTAARALPRVGDAELASRILDSWGELSLVTRRELCTALVSSRTSAALLVRALEDEKVAPVEIDMASRDVLLRQAEPAVRKRALLILARSAPADRRGVVDRYQAVLKLAGDAARGAMLFARNCQTCHLHQGQGHAVGPDLSGIAGRPPDVLLSDILDPNREVAADFVALTVTTQRGAVLSGLLVEETGSSLKLRRAEGIDETILRSEITEVHSSGRSLMPEGLEQALSLQEMADLLAFLRSGQKTPG